MCLAVKDQGSVAPGAALCRTRYALLNDTAAEIRIDQALLCSTDGVA